LKRKLTEYNVRLDDYVPPDNVNPLVLKLDRNGNEIDIETAMDKINARIKEIEKAHAHEQELLQNKSSTKEAVEPKESTVIESKVLKDPKELEKTETEK